MTVELNSLHVRSVVENLRRDDLVSCGITMREGKLCFLVRIQATDTAAIPKTVKIDGEEFEIIAIGNCRPARFLRTVGKGQPLLNVSDANNEWNKKALEMSEAMRKERIEKGV